MNRFLLPLLPLLTALSCYSAGGDGDGDGYAGGSGGSFARGGSGGDCGPCPGAACQQPLTLMISADAEVAPANLSKVEVIVVEGTSVTLDCYGYSDCSVNCQSLEYQLTDGHYAVNIAAPGFVPTLHEFDIVNPTNCGCCGCCPGSYYGLVTLVPDGSELETCCADLMNDALNCGSCGLACDAGLSCVEGSCVASR
jgi:hypothetical protein